MYDKPLPNRLTWLTIVFAFIGSLVMYGMLAYTLDSSGARAVTEGLETIRLPISLLAIFVLLASIVWAQLRLTVHAMSPSSATDLLPPQKYIANTLISLALAEACAIVGLLMFFLGASYGEFLVFVVPSAVVMAVVILPKGIAYWQVWENRPEG